MIIVRKFVFHRSHTIDISNSSTSSFSSSKFYFISLYFSHSFSFLCHLSSQANHRLFISNFQPQTAFDEVTITRAIGFHWTPPVKSTSTIVYNNTSIIYSLTLLNTKSYSHNHGKISIRFRAFRNWARFIVHASTLNVLVWKIRLWLTMQ